MTEEEKPLSVASIPNMRGYSEKFECTGNR